MSDEEEHESRCGESFPMSALNPQRSTATSARCSFPLALSSLSKPSGPPGIECTQSMPMR
jgi:hypothetical protein